MLDALLESGELPVERLDDSLDNLIVCNSFIEDLIKLVLGYLFSVQVTENLQESGLRKFCEIVAVFDNFSVRRGILVIIKTAKVQLLAFLDGSCRAVRKSLRLRRILKHRLAPV